MKDTKRQKPSDRLKDYAVDNFPGAAVNHADDNEVDSALVKERTRTLNNNPRNHH
ncbi:MAG: hypothetical protein NC418_05525 [Muribaculaceae bacterium]|nr:hypothetical protein [Muribaculaceae bacterium]